MARDDRTAPPDAGTEPAIDAGVEAAIDALYQGPLSAFIDERNRLVRALRGRDREAAERVRALAKPSLSAWAVNQAYWHARAPFAAMLDAGEALRAQQQQVMRGQPSEGLAAASARLHEAVAPVARAAQRALEQDRHGAGSQLMRRVLTTLQAVAAHGRGDAAPPAGRLSADVSAPGFELLTALAPGPGAARAPAGPRLVTRAGAEADPGAALAASLAAEHRAGAGPAVPGEPRAGMGPRMAHRSAHGSPGRRATAPRSRQEAQARHAARIRVANAKAALVARGRALTAAERAELAAAERLDAAAAAVAEARAALDRATMAQERAMQVHEQARAEADQARAALGAARYELECAEEQVDTPANGQRGDGPEPA